MKSTLFVIDAYNLIYRMFYAIPEMHTREGMQVNAIFGVAKFLKWLAEENPSAKVVIASDVGKSFREELFAEYKGTRDKMPDNLRSQIDGVFELFSVAEISVIWKTGYEADDVMGSIAKQYATYENQVIIISSDKDLCQFVQDDFVHIYDAMKRKFMREKDVFEKFWVPNSQVRDYLAIVWDSADNIPGIAWFGPKKAVAMLEKYGSIEKIYENLSDFTPKMRDSLEQGRGLALLSQKLATIVTDLNLDINTSDEVFAQKIIKKPYQDLLRKYEFRSLVSMENWEEEKKDEISFREIINYSEYEELIHFIKNSKEYVGISVDNEKKIYISKDWLVYVLDAKKMDVSDFIHDILNENIYFSTYDMKSLFMKLKNIQNPLLKNSPQESLF